MRVFLRRSSALIATVVITGTVLSTPPVVAHITKKVAHAWKHLQPLADVRYELKGTPAQWSQIQGLPAGFADGIDNEGSTTGPATDLACTACVSTGELDFDPATQNELDTHKGSTDHDGRYYTESELNTSDGSGPNIGSNRVHWNVLGGVPAGFADGADDVGPPAWLLGGNAGTTGSNFVGTTDNQALDVRVNDVRAFRLEPNGTDAANVIGGISSNSVTSGVVGATMSGGGQPGFPNRVTDDRGTVSGGVDNQAGDASGTTSDNPYATVGGGGSNTASGGAATVGGGGGNIASGPYATVGGGSSNEASGSRASVSGGDNNQASGSLASVSGGDNNQASGSHASVSGGAANAASGFLASVSGGAANAATADHATVGGGASNLASGTRSTVPGGQLNTASGDYSFAAGRAANADDQGAFLWADSQAAFISSPGTNTFTARAAGGFFLEDDSTVTSQGGFINTDTGAYLTTGGVWTNASSRYQKSGFALVDGRDVLDRVADLPITTWQYDAEPGVVHIGPVSEDFHAAFGVGSNDRTIGTVDADGVALAAIQGLNDKLEERLGELEARLAGDSGGGIASTVWWQGLAVLGFALGIVLGGRGLSRSRVV